MRTETYYKLPDFDTLSQANEFHTRNYGRLRFHGRKNSVKDSCITFNYPTYDEAFRTTADERNAAHIVPFVPIDSTLVHLVPTNPSPLPSSFFKSAHPIQLIHQDFTLSLVLHRRQPIIQTRVHTILPNSPLIFSVDKLPHAQNKRQGIPPSTPGKP